MGKYDSNQSIKERGLRHHNRRPSEKMNSLRFLFDFSAALDNSA
jgi:hypothetical protein